MTTKKNKLTGVNKKKAATRAIVLLVIGAMLISTVLMAMVAIV